jgi:hypothetical protein
MARDYRVRPESQAEKFARLALDNWQTLSDEQKRNLLVETPTAEELESRTAIAWTLSLQRSLARSLEPLRVTTRGDVDWKDVAAVFGATREAMFFEAMLSLEGEASARLIAAAQRHLTDTPESEWLWTIRSRGELTGLKELRTVASGWLDLWCRVDAGWSYPHDLQDSVGLAIAFLAERDRSALLALLKSIRDPFILKLLCDRHFDDVRLSLQLVSRDEPMIAALGLDAFLSYVRALDNYIEHRVKALDPYGNEALEVEPILVEQTAIQREVATSASQVLEHLSAGSHHDELLGEFLAEALRAVTAGRSVTAQQLHETAVEFVSRRMRREPAAEARIIEALRRSGAQAIAAAEVVAELVEESDSELAKRLRRQLVAHLRERLSLPSRESLEGPRSSQTDPLKPYAYSSEQRYVTLVARALANLAATENFDPLELFRELFGQLELLGRRRDRAFSLWLASAPRAALLMLIGRMIVVEFSNLSQASGLTDLLGRELTERGPEWEQYQGTGYNATSELENVAIAALGPMLSSAAAISSLKGLQSVCSALAIVRTNDATRSILDQVLERNFGASVLLMDETMLVHLLRQLCRWGLWRYYGQTLERYRQVVAKTRTATRLPVQLIEERFFEALGDVYYAERSVGSHKLVRLCEEIERYRMRDSRTQCMYLVALRLRLGYSGHDEALEMKMENTLRFSRLMGVRLCDA